MYHHCWKHVRNSISAKFLATFLFVLIIPLLILTQLFARRMHAVLREKEQAYISEKITYTQTQFDRIFSEMDNIAVSLILDYHVTDVLLDPSAVPTYDWFIGYKTLNSLLTLLSSNANYSYGITISGYDNTVYQVNANYNNLLNTASPTVLRAQSGNGSPVIFNRALERLDTNPVVTLGRSIYQKSEYVGTILVDVPTAHLDSLFNPYDNDTTQLYVLKDNREIIYSSVSTGESAIPTLIQQALETHSSSVTLSGTRYLLSQMPTRQSSLSVVTLVAEDSVFRGSSQTIFIFVLSFSLLICMTIIGIFALTLIFTRHIRILNDAVIRFGNSPTADICIPIRSQDEIGQLTQGILSMFEQIKELLTRIQQTERKKRILEFDALQAQINPHMIYNTLNTITYLAQIQNAKNIEEISSSFTHLLRSISNQGEFITIAQEIEYLKSFIAVKKYNLLSNIQTEFQIDENAASCRILKLLLQPIVENSIIHGFAGRIEDGILSISVQRSGGMISIDISDNGIGIDESRLQLILEEEKPSNTFLRIGIRNIIERLKLQYGESASFSIFSAPDCGTTVHICYPAEPVGPEGS